MTPTSSGTNGRQVTALDWQTIRDLLARLNIPKGIPVYGVPRGGAIVAGLLGNPVTDPTRAAVIVDDIVDSGHTRRKWAQEFPGKPFAALVDKTVGDYPGQWIQFPWENPPDIDAETSIVRLLEFIGEDPNREGLKDTPRRVIKAWKELTAGYHQNPHEILGTQFDGNGYDEMVVSRNIEFNSTCEHHMLPFIGVAHIAYIPRKRVVGLSKLARLVDCFAKRLQIQEKMTAQILDAINTTLRPKGAGVILRAQHTCQSCRGVGKHQSDMTTTALAGNFKDHKVREEFFMHCNAPK